MYVCSPNGQSNTCRLLYITQVGPGWQDLYTTLERLKGMSGVQSWSSIFGFLCFPCFFGRRPFGLVMFRGRSRRVVSTASMRMMAAHGMPGYRSTVAATDAVSCAVVRGCPNSVVKAMVVLLIKCPGVRLLAAHTRSLSLFCLCSKKSPKTELNSSGNDSPFHMWMDLDELYIPLK